MFQRCRDSFVGEFSENTQKYKEILGASLKKELTYLCLQNKCTAGSVRNVNKHWSMFFPNTAVYIFVNKKYVCFWSVFLDENKK